MNIRDVKILMAVKDLLVDVIKGRDVNIRPDKAMAACEVLQRVMFPNETVEELRAAYAHEFAN